MQNVFWSNGIAYRLVPVEPTDEMIEAGMPEKTVENWRMCQQIYHDMIEFAPQIQERNGSVGGVPRAQLCHDCALRSQGQASGTQTEPTRPQLEAFIKRAGFTWGWRELESWARRMAERAVLELNRLQAEQRELEENASRLEALIALCGYVEDGSDVAVTLSQDDATREWVVRVGSNSIFTGRSAKQAIDAALEKQK